MSLTVVCWKWQPPRGYRSTYSPTTVNVLRRMVERHYPHPHRFVCVTDDPEGINSDVEIVPMWQDFADVPSPHGGKNPSCYRRLRLFAPDIATVFGERFVSLDLDTVITGDVSSLWNRPDDVVFWGDTNPRTHYNGSMMLLRAGARPQVWEQFDPVESPRRALLSGCFGSDQGWISYVLGPGEAKWGKSDGVYSFRNDIAANPRQLPGDARVVCFHGNHDPWSPYVQINCPWVKEHWC